VNTGTTIVAFLMVLVMQNTQNRDAAAIQAELDGIRAKCEAKAKAESAAEEATSQFGMVLFAAVQTLVREGDLG
jgi:low affinity Fe/Cu permease